MPSLSRWAIGVVALTLAGCGATAAPAPAAPAEEEPGTTGSAPLTAPNPTAPATLPPTIPVSTTVAPATASPPAAAASDPTAPDPTAPAPPFTFLVAEIPADLQARMAGASWRPQCPVPIEQLRIVSLSLWDFDGMPQIGQLVVNVDVVPDIEIIFGRLFAARFPIRQMRVIDDFGADDFASIEADNTSSFNCRLRTGSSDEWSQHSYGRAIDVNPIENPYISTDGRVAHRASRPFLDRADVRPGMAVEGSALVAAFEAQGWGWGGRWAGPIDLQHFSKDGR